MKKPLLLIIVGALLLTGLTGCGEKKELTLEECKIKYNDLLSDEKSGNFTTKEIIKRKADLDIACAAAKEKYTRDRGSKVNIGPNEGNPMGGRQW